VVAYDQAVVLHVTDRPTAMRRALNFKLQACLYVPQKVKPLCPLARRRPPNQYIHPRGVRPLCTVCDGHKRDLSRPRLRCERPAAAFFARPARVPSTSRRSAQRCAAWSPARHAGRSDAQRAGRAARSGSTRGRPRWSARAGPRRFDDPARTVNRIAREKNGRRPTA
jgi:hypothetical protein